MSTKEQKKKYVRSTPKIRDLGALDRHRAPQGPLCHGARAAEAFSTKLGSKSSTAASPLPSRGVTPFMLTHSPNETLSQKHPRKRSLESEDAVIVPLW